jgi:predicted DNA-binding transcriptional regulator AlpA
MAPKILSKADLKAMGIDLNSSTIWRKTKAGQFPKPVKIGNRNGWIDSEIYQYMEGLIAARDGG